MIEPLLSVFISMSAKVLQDDVIPSLDFCRPHTSTSYRTVCSSNEMEMRAWVFHRLTSADRCRTMVDGRWFFWFFIVSADMEMRYIIMELKTCPLPWILWYEPKVSVSVSMNRIAGSNVRPGHKFGFPAGLYLLWEDHFVSSGFMLRMFGDSAFEKCLLTPEDKGSWKEERSYFVGQNLRRQIVFVTVRNFNKFCFLPPSSSAPSFVNIKNDTHLSTSLQTIW